MTEPLLCDLSVSGRKGLVFPEPDVPSLPFRVDLSERCCPCPKSQK